MTDVKRIIAATSQHCHSVEVWSVKGNVYDYEGLYMLLAATVRRAQVDAKRGDKAAKRWLKGFLAGVKC